MLETAAERIEDEIEEAPGVEAIFPAHKWALTLSHNPHMEAGLALIPWIVSFGIGKQPFKWVDPVQRELATIHNEIWILRWTPKVSQKTVALAAHSLTELLNIADALVAAQEPDSKP